MRFLSLVITASLVVAVSARLSCIVKALGGGQDDGPNILKAFDRCKSKGKVILDQYYVIDTLLLTTGLDDVEIELSGTSKDFAIMCNRRRSHALFQSSTRPTSSNGPRRATT